MVKIAFCMQSSFYEQPDKVLMNIHSAIYGKCETHFVAASYLYINLEKMKLLHSNAGHTPFIIHKKNSGELITANSRGKIIGLVPIDNCEMREISIEFGDRIILYTDCVTETRNSAGDFYGEERFHSYIKEKSHESAEQFIQNLQSHLEVWSANKGLFEDDLTIIVIDVLLAQGGLFS
jgi:serine phosphatase RsbU (regulator of sigma subunit)